MVIMLSRVVLMFLLVALIPATAAGITNVAEETVAGGSHKRLLTRKGAIHLWWPKDYDKDHAGVVIYLHGYGTTVDKEWTGSHLGKKFNLSKKNALFIVPESSSSDKDDITWFSLESLFSLLKNRFVKIPAGKVVLMGHSGAFKTMALWVKNKRISTVVMLDAMYGLYEKYKSFLTGSKSSRMIVVSYSTYAAGKDFGDMFDFTLGRRYLPKTIKGFTKKERRARLLHIYSQYDHFELVTS
ncbi:hypothetical protein KKF84_04275, partial [Myxococcota bacterium]|nr:hypothetical protein [Myxococcota bacterium]